MKFYTNVEKIGNYIYLTGYDADGKKCYEKIEYKPVIFLPSKNPNAEYKSLQGLPLDSFYPGTIKESDEFLQRYQDVDNFDYFGMERWIYNFLADKFPERIEYDFDQFNFGFFDIETDSENGWPDINSANKEILIVSFYFKKKYHIFSIEKHGVFKTNRDDVISETFSNEEDMLKTVVNFWQSCEFDIISGWNSEYFDIPYLINRIKRVLNDDWAKKLSPWNILKPKTLHSYNGDMNSYTIVGVNHIDYLDAFKKFGFANVENYRLDTVGQEELGMGKLDYSEYDGKMHEFYQKDWNKFCDYNLRDNEILVGLDEKKRLAELIVSLSLYAKVNPIDTFKQTVMWDAIYYNYLLERKIIIPKKPHRAMTRNVPGGFVKESRPGTYDWCMSEDLDSSYPHQCIEYNISPETFVKMIDVDLEDLVEGRDCEAVRYAKENNYVLAANGALFRKDKRGFIPEIMEMLYAERKAYKKEMLEKQAYLEQHIHDMVDEDIKKLKNEISKLNMFQNNRKTQLNSAYGSLAEVSFRFFDEILASAITVSGQLSIRWIERKFNELLQKKLGIKTDLIIASDTDSVYIHVGPLVDDILKKKPNLSQDEIVDFLIVFADKVLKPYSEKSYQEMAEMMNSYTQAMRLKLENIMSRMVILAKKKYIANVLDGEGVRYETPKLKTVGVELVRSNTPNYCKEKMKDICKIVLEKEEKDVVSYIDNVKKEFYTLPFEEIAQPTGVKGVTKYTDSKGNYSSGTPIYVRAAILHNKLIDEKKLNNNIRKITDGDKIKYCYLKTPNPIFENTIGCQYKLPKEFQLEQYIDYNVQFDKVFLSPVKRILDARGWDIEKKESLDDFWS